MRVDLVKLVDTELSLKLRKAQEAFMVQAQQYHLLANIISNDRHTSTEWSSCQEQTCKDAKKLYHSIWNE